MNGEELRYFENLSIEIVGAASPGGPPSYETSSPYLLFSPNVKIIRTGRTRRRGTGFTSRPRRAGTLRRTVRSFFPHRAMARWGPQCGPPNKLRFRLSKKVAAPPRIKNVGRVLNPPLRRFRRFFPLIFCRIFNRTCRGRLSRRPAEFPAIYLSSPYGPPPTAAHVIHNGFQ